MHIISRKTLTLNVVINGDNGTVDKNKKDATNCKETDSEARFNPENNPEIPKKISRMEE